MGRYLRPGTQECYDFKPDDTDTEMFIDRNMMGGISLQDILALAKEKWPDATFENIEVTPEHIHTHAIFHDMHDGSDWTFYLRLTYSPRKEPE
jgi:hypothetical protein